MFRRYLTHEKWPWQHWIANLSDECMMVDTIGLGVSESASICENQNYRLNGSHLISAQSFSLVEAAHSYMGGEAEHR